MSTSTADVLDIDKIMDERVALFDDLFADRQRSVRRILEETFQQEMKALHEREKREKPKKPRTSDPESSVVEDPLDAPYVPIRYRAPTTSTPAHDVFGDAVHTLFQKLMSRGQMADYCHYLSYVLTQITSERKNFNYEEIKYVPGMYLNAQDCDEAKKVFTEQMWPSADYILIRDASTMPQLNDKWTGIHISADQKRGSRHKQEDRFIAYPSGLFINRKEDPIALLGVFDGHGGAECSQYAAGHMWEEWIIARQQAREDAGDLVETLKNSLVRLDERLTVRSQKEVWKGGTTAVCCAVDVENKEMAFAWLGDSPGYVMSNIEFRKITREHSPSDPEEASRVEAAGGQLFVIGGELRVNGVLNLTRALGDVQGRPMISNEPETTRVVIEPADYLVLLACDGVSDVLDVRMLYKEVTDFVTTNPVEKYIDLARHICAASLNADSTDNVTVVIGFLRPPEDLWNLMSERSSSGSSELTSADSSDSSDSDGGEEYREEGGYRGGGY